MGKRKVGRPRITEDRALKALEWKSVGKGEAWIADELGLKCYRNEDGRRRCRSVSRYVERGREIEANKRGSIARIKENLRQLTRPGTQPLEP